MHANEVKQKTVNSLLKLIYFALCDMLSEKKKIDTYIHVHTCSVVKKVRFLYNDMVRLDMIVYKILNKSLIA